MNKFKDYLTLIRIHQIPKNFFIFLPLIFTSKFLILDDLVKSILYFLLFTIITWSVYIINDIKDIEEDKLHPIKKYRPLASNKISKNELLIIRSFLSFLFLLISFIWFIFIGIDLNFILALIVLSTYFLINILYSYFFKRIPYIELTIVPIGFILRSLGGAYIINEYLSIDLFLLILFLTSFIILSKRFREKFVTKSSRSVLKVYTNNFLNYGLKITLSLFLITYTLFTLFNTRHSSLIIITNPFVYLISIRYLNLITNSNDKQDDPFKIFIKDKFNLFLIILWGIIVVIETI